jgi:hypothetical protein
LMIKKINLKSAVRNSFFFFFNAEKCVLRFFLCRYLKNCHNFFLRPPWQHSVKAIRVSVSYSSMLYAPNDPNTPFELSGSPNVARPFFFW